MNTFYHERIALAWERLVDGLRPYLEETLQAEFGERWIEVARGSQRHPGGYTTPNDPALHWDAQLVLLILFDQWHNVYRNRLGPLERSLMSELREYRNQWAHQGQFDFTETYRILDSVQRLLRAVSAPEADEVRLWAEDLMRRHVQEVVDGESRQAANLAGRNRLMFVTMVCCGAIVVQAFLAFGWRSLIFSVFVVASFAYVMIRRLYYPEATYRMHECGRCGRVIYGDPCPYCISRPGRPTARLVPETAAARQPA